MQSKITYKLWQKFDTLILISPDKIRLSKSIWTYACMRKSIRVCAAHTIMYTQYKFLCLNVSKEGLHPQLCLSVDDKKYSKQLGPDGT